MHAKKVTRLLAWSVLRHDAIHCLHVVKVGHHCPEKLSCRNLLMHVSNLVQRAVHASLHFILLAAQGWHAVQVVQGLCNKLQSSPAKCVSCHEEYMTISLYRICSMSSPDCSSQARCWHCAYRGFAISVAGFSDHGLAQSDFDPDDSGLQCGCGGF